MKIDKRKCPICGKNNSCIHEQDLQDDTCWCSHIEVPKELIAQIPDNLKGKACICHDCIIEFKAKHQL